MIRSLLRSRSSTRPTGLVTSSWYRRPGHRHSLSGILLAMRYWAISVVWFGPMLVVPSTRRIWASWARLDGHATRGTDNEQSSSVEVPKSADWWFEKRSKQGCQDELDCRHCFDKLADTRRHRVVCSVIGVCRFRYVRTRDRTREEKSGRPCTNPFFGTGSQSL